MSLENPNNGPKMNRREFLGMAAGAVGAFAVPAAPEDSQNIAEDVHITSSGETIPSQEGLRKVFDVLLAKVREQTGIETFSDAEHAEDEEGVYLWEQTFPIEGGVAGFGYLREGRHPGGWSATDTKIHVVFYDANGIPEGGHDVATFTDGNWIIDEEIKNLI